MEGLIAITQKQGMDLSGVRVRTLPMRLKSGEFTSGGEARRFIQKGKRTYQIDCISIDYAMGEGLWNNGNYHALLTDNEKIKNLERVFRNHKDAHAYFSELPVSYPAMNMYMVKEITPLQPNKKIEPAFQR